MPRQGNTVESCIILEWKKQEGDSIQEGEVLCEVETDKATFEVEAEAGGTVLKQFFEEGADVPVLTPIAVIGEPGEEIGGLGPEEGPGGRAVGSGVEASSGAADTAVSGTAGAHPNAAGSSSPAGTVASPAGNGKIRISPRAKLLAESKGIDYRTVAGSGPGGRIIERDIKYVVEGREPLTAETIQDIISSNFQTSTPAKGDKASKTGAEAASKIKADKGSVPSGGGAARTEFPGPTSEYPVKGVRKVIAGKMLNSVTTTAQLTLNSSADARSLLAYRKQLNNSPGEFGLQDITINHIVLYVVSRILPRFPEMNAHFLEDKIVEFDNVHLGFAVDTFKGLMVPKIRNANLLSLKKVAEESKRLASACFDSTVEPDELAGGTFTVTNLGSLGIESFTPVLNPPEVGILGVCAIQPKAVMNDDGEVEHTPHIGLSLTFNHQATDGAPAARFLKQLSYALAHCELFLAE